MRCGSLTSFPVVLLFVFDICLLCSKPTLRCVNRRGWTILQSIHLLIFLYLSTAFLSSLFLYSLINCCCCFFFFFFHSLPFICMHTFRSLFHDVAGVTISVPRLLTFCLYVQLCVRMCESSHVCALVCSVGVYADFPWQQFCPFPYLTAETERKGMGIKLGHSICPSFCFVRFSSQGNSVLQTYVRK